MNTLKKKILLASALIFLLTTVLYFTVSTKFLSSEKEIKDQKEALHPHEHDEKKPLYQCPMHPQITSERSGQTCPICGMNLVEVQLDEDDAVENDLAAPTKDPQKTKPVDQRAKVKMSTGQQQLIGVKLERVTKRKLFKAIHAPGRIAFDPELYTAQSEYLEALRQWSRVKNSPLRAVKKSTKEMIRSSKIKLKVLGLSEDQIKKFQTKGVLSEDLLLSGAGKESWVYANVFEMDTPYLKKDLSAEISASFLQGKKLAGTLVAIDQVIDPKTRSVKVRIRLKPTKKTIRPESYVNVTIFSPLGEHLSVPSDAVMDTGKETFVFVKKKKGRFEPRKVNVLLETDEFFAIDDTLSEGEEVVVGGNFMLDSESRLKSVLKEASSEGKAKP